MQGAGTQDRQIEADGKTYTLRYSFSAWERLQEHWDLEAIEDVLARLEEMKRPGAKDIAVLFWAGLARHHPDLGLRDVVNILDDAGVDVLGDVFKGMAASLPQPVAGEAGPKAAPGPRKARSAPRAKR